MGGLNRKKDYGSKKKPYPKVKKKDFAGGHRSYPIPTKADAVDALRLAGLHGRSDVKAKVYARYPELRKKSAMGTKRKINNKGTQYQDPNDPNVLYGLTNNNNQAPLSPSVEELSDYSKNNTDYKSNKKRMNHNGYMRNWRRKQRINDQPNKKKAPMGTRIRQYNRYVKHNQSNLDLKELQRRAIRAGYLDKGYTGNEEETATALNLADPRFIHTGITGSQPISAEEFQQGHDDFMKYLESERGEYYDPNLEVDASQHFVSDEEWQKYKDEHPEKFNITGSNTAKERDNTNKLETTDTTPKLRSPLSYWEPYANLASNLAGTTGTFISARDEARKMRISPIANPTPIMKGNTKIGIGDELATIREGLASNIRNFSTNTGSSALMNQRRTTAFTTGQGLYRQAFQNKYNKEAELQNADIARQQSVHSENTKEANARNQQRTTERNARNKELHEAKQHAISGYINGANQFFTALSNIGNNNNTVALQLAGKNVTPDELKNKYGVRRLFR